MKTLPFWIITVDCRSATLFDCTRTRTGGLQLDQVRDLKNSHSEWYGRQRTELFAIDKGRFARLPQSVCQMELSTSYSRQADMELLQFVHDVKTWLTRASSAFGVRDAILLGSPRVFDLLVTHLSNIDMNIEFRGGGLKDLSLQDFADHQLAAYRS